MKTIFAFLRHGETEWNKERRIQGLINNPLNEEGIKQAHNVGKKLQNTDPAWDIIITSPLARARSTAEIILNYLPDVPLLIEEDFRERDFGKAEGEAITKEIFDKIIANDIVGLEDSSHLQKRVFQALKRIAIKYPNKRIFVVAHSHVIKALLTLIDDNFTFRDPLENTALFYFSYKDETISLI